MRGRAGNRCAAGWARRPVGIGDLKARPPGPTGLLARCAVVFVFFLALTGALVPLLRQGSGSSASTAEGDPITQLMWLAVYAVAFVWGLTRWRRFLAVATKDKLLLLLIALAVVSVLWSAAPEVTLRRGIALTGTTLVGIGLAARFGFAELLRLLAWALGIAAVLSLLFALALPSYGISSDSLTQGDWKGVFDHKNTLGKAMSLSAIVFLLLALSSRGYRWLLWAAFALSFALIVLSGSKTALSVTVVLIVLLPLFGALRLTTTLALSISIFVALFAAGMMALLGANLESLLTFLGKDLTLTGRTTVWAVVVDTIQERPWLGYGYNGFWLGTEGPSFRVWLATGEPYYDSHNGIMDLWLDLGAVGVAVFLIGFFRALGRAVGWVHATSRAENLWPMMFLTFMLVYNLTESFILKQNNLFWLLYVVAALKMAAWREEAALLRQTGDSGPRDGAPGPAGLSAGPSGGPPV